MPRPQITNAGTSCHALTSTPIDDVSQTTPTVSDANPNIATYLPDKRSDSRPANGATTPDTSDIGSVVRPDSTGDRPSTDCRKITTGRNMPVMANPTQTFATLAAENVRLPNRDSGSSGSLELIRCHTT